MEDLHVSTSAGTRKTLTSVSSKQESTRNMADDLAYDVIFRGKAGREEQIWMKHFFTNI